jgi:hypothetical protein
VPGVQLQEGQKVDVGLRFCQQGERRRHRQDFRIEFSLQRVCCN